MADTLKKAVVLCAGEGTRLRPLTFSRPKHLLPVAGRPLLGWALAALAEAGIEQVGLVVGHRAEAIQRYVGDGSSWGMNASYVTQEKPLGLGHAVNSARDFIGEDSFLLYLGDNVLEHGVTGLVAEFEARQPAALLSVKEVSDPRAYGVAVLEDAIIGPYVSIGPGCSVRDSRVEDCIIQQDCRVEHLRAGLSDSVLGTEVEVVAAESGSTAPLSLLLGDMSHIRAQ